MDFQQLIKKNKWLIAIFLFALIVRVAFVFSMPVKLWDETIYLNLGYDLSNNPFDYSFSNGWSDFIPSNGDDLYGNPKAGFRAPLLPYIISFFYFINWSFIVEFIIPIIGALSVILIYILAKEMFNHRVGLISAFFTALIPLHVFYSSRTLTEVLCTFFIILAFISFWKGYEKKDNKHKVLFGVFIALALLSRYTALWIMPIFLLYFLVRDRSFNFLKEKYIWHSVIAFLLTLLPLFFYGIFEYNNPFGAFIHGFKASAYWGGVQLWNFFFVYWWYMFSIIGIVFVIALIYIIFKKDFMNKEIYFLIIGFAFFFGMAVYMPHKEDRFIIPIIPQIVILTSYFIDKIKLNKKFIGVIGLVLIFSLIVRYNDTYQTHHNTNINCFEQVGVELKKIPGDFIIVSENPPLFRYYSKQESKYYPDIINEKTIQELEKNTDKKIYFIFTRFNSGFETDKWKRLKEIMIKNYGLVFECAEDKKVNWIYSN